MEQEFTIIGISDSREQFFPPETVKAISEGTVFSGGIRHREIMQDMLPEGHTWINITVPLDGVFDAYAGHKKITVFASGDPLFFGFANTVKNRLPDAKITVMPYFNSLQMLAHRFMLPYGTMKNVSLTGREWKEFDKALITGEKMIGILTDRHKTPAAIASRMLEYGYTGYTMYIGELIGNSSEERLRKVSIEEAAAITGLKFPNAAILEMTSPKERTFGIPENRFSLLDGRAAMITKMPIRLLTLSMLGLENRKSLWDVGFCTGSVSVEARLLFPHLDITSFEIREQGKRLMEENSRKFGAPGIHAIIGNFLDIPVGELPAPDAVFIGGHNGKLKEIIGKICNVLLPGGTIVLNSVSPESERLFKESASAYGLEITGHTRIAVDEHNPITILKAESK